MILDKNKIAVIVLSCDKYSDLWEGMFRSLDFFWKDCKHDIYLVSNYNLFKNDNHILQIKPILIGKDESWSKNVKKALNILKDKYDYAIITLEDLFLVDYVDIEKLEKTINKATSESLDYLRLHRNFQPNSKKTSYYSFIPKTEPYRFNCTYSLWRIKYLLDLLKEDENAWEFEYNSPKRAKVNDKTYIVNQTLFTYSNTVIKGKWVPSEKEIINKLFPDYKITRASLSNQEEKKIKRKENFFYLLKMMIPSSMLNGIITLYRKFK